MRKIMYKTSETIVYKVQEYADKKAAVVIGNGDIIDFRPMRMQEPLYSGCDVYVFYFRKENKGLKSSGEELAKWLISMEEHYTKIFLVMKSKCGNMVITSVVNNLTNYRKYKIFVVNAPLAGTVAATPKELRRQIYRDKKLWNLPVYFLEDIILTKIVYGDYPIDHDIQVGAEYMKNYLKKKEVADKFDITVIAGTLRKKKCKTILDFILRWFDKRFEFCGDGIVPLKSQMSFKEPARVIVTNHITVLDDSKKIIQKEIDKEKL